MYAYLTTLPHSLSTFLPTGLPARLSSLFPSASQPLPTYPQLRSTASLWASTAHRLRAFASTLSLLLQQAGSGSDASLALSSRVRLQRGLTLCEKILDAWDDDAWDDNEVEQTSEGGGGDEGDEGGGHRELLRWGWDREAGVRIGAQRTERVCRAWKYWSDEEKRRGEFACLPEVGVRVGVKECEEVVGRLEILVNEVGVLGVREEKGKGVVGRESAPGGQDTGGDAAVAGS